MLSAIYADCRYAEYRGAFYAGHQLRNTCPKILDQGECRRQLQAHWYQKVLYYIPRRSNTQPNDTQHDDYECLKLLLKMSSCRMPFVLSITMEEHVFVIDNRKRHWKGFAIYNVNEINLQKNTFK